MAQRLCDLLFSLLNGRYDATLFGGRAKGSFRPLLVQAFRQPKKVYFLMAMALFAEKGYDMKATIRTPRRQMNVLDIISCNLRRRSKFVQKSLVDSILATKAIYLLEFEEQSAVQTLLKKRCAK